MIKAETQVMWSSDYPHWDFAVEAAGALEIDVELVGTVRHHQEQNPSAVRRVGHELLDARDDARRRAAVAFAVRVAERAVAFVDDDDHLADGANDVEDLFQIPLRRADPLGAEVLQLDRRQPALFRERLGDEGLSGPHRAGEEDAHRHAGGSPVRMLLAMTSRSFFTSSMPPTTSNPCSGSTNSTRPKHSRSSISRLRFAMSRSVSLRARSIGPQRESGVGVVPPARPVPRPRQGSVPVSAASLCARPRCQGRPEEAGDVRFAVAIPLRRGWRRQDRPIRIAFSPAVIPA